MLYSSVLTCLLRNLLSSTLSSSNSLSNVIPEYLEQTHGEILTPNYYYSYSFLSSLYLPLSSVVHYSL